MYTAFLQRSGVGRRGENVETLSEGNTVTLQETSTEYLVLRTCVQVPSKKLWQRSRSSVQRVQRACHLNLNGPGKDGAWPSNKDRREGRLMGE